MLAPLGVHFEYFCGGDIDNALNRLTVPPAAQAFLTQPGIYARHLCIKSVQGQAVDGQAWVVPHMRVLPMGWAWSLHLCRCVHEIQGELAGQSAEKPILDRSPALHLSESDFNILCRCPKKTIL